jgi:hypothetical protein
MSKSTWTKLAAATGIDFVAIGVAVGVLAQVNDFENSGDFALQASNEMWASYTLLTGFAAIFFFWFTATASARLRQLEWGYGGSGRLAATFLASGAAIAGIIALGTGVQFAARQGAAATGLASLATALLEGPTLAFPIAVYIGAAGVVGYRSEGLPTYSRWLALVSLPTAAAFVAIAGLQLFKNYAWIDETGYFTFLAWVLALSVVGVMRWGELDASAPGSTVGLNPQPLPPSPAPEIEEPPAVVQRAPARKPRARKAAPRKR